MSTRQRARGEGSVYTTKDGLHVAIGYDANGKRVPFKSRKSERDAVARRTAARQRLAAAMPVTDSRTRLRTILATFETDVLPASGRRLATQALYRRLLGNHAMPTLGERPVGSIRPADVEALLTSKAATLSASTRRSLYAALRALFDYAVRDGLVARNPVAAVRRPTLEHREAHALEADEVRRLLDAASGDRLGALFVLLAGTGMRKGEALGLRWSDVDAEHGLLRVRRTLSRIDGVGLVENDPKSARSRRTIDLGEPVVAALASHRVRQIEERLAAGPAWEDENRVFTTTVGTALDPRKVNRVFTAIATEAGVKATPHTMRHSAATALLDAGHPVAVVSEHLGHSSAVVTMTTYAHALPTARKAAAEALGGLVTG